MHIRPYERNDAEALVTLFYETVRVVNAADYTAEQLHAWAPVIPDPAVWHERMAKRHTLVVEEKGKLFAFAELDDSGYLEMFYCRHDIQRQGIGSWLFDQLQTDAVELGLSRIFTDASITARPFFERQGFRLVKQNSVVRDGVEMINFTMEKRLV